MKDNIEALFRELEQVKHELRHTHKPEEQAKLHHRAIDLNNRYYHLTKQIVYIDYKRENGREI